MTRNNTKIFLAGGHIELSLKIKNMFCNYSSGQNNKVIPALNPMVP